MSQIRDVILSPREREVLDLVLMGCTYKEITERLVIAPSTVRNHMNNILSRLGVPDRTAVVALVLNARIAELETGVQHCIHEYADHIELADTYLGPITNEPERTAWKVSKLRYRQMRDDLLRLVQPSPVLAQKA